MLPEPFWQTTHIVIGLLRRTAMEELGTFSTCSAPLRSRVTCAFLQMEPPLVAITLLQDIKEAQDPFRMCEIPGSN